MEEEDAVVVVIVLLALLLFGFMTYYSQPLAGFEYKPQGPEPQEPIVFEANHDNDEYRWNMKGVAGDHPGGEWEKRGSKVVYTFSEPGKYTVTLKVEDGSPTSSSDKSTKVIHVRNESDETKNSGIGEKGDGSKTTNETTPLGNAWTFLKRTDVVLGIVASILTIALYLSRR